MSMEENKKCCDRTAGCSAGGFGCVPNACGCSLGIDVPEISKHLSDEQKDKREQHRIVIQESIRGDRAALVLGAGIGKQIGLPLWGEMLSIMMGYGLQYSKLEINPDDVDEEKKRYFKLANALIRGHKEGKPLTLWDDINVLEAGKYIALMFADDDIGYDKKKTSAELQEQAIKVMVRKILDAKVPSAKDFYKKLKDNYSGKTTKNGDIPVKEKSRINTMYAVAYLMSRKGNGIRRAISYNYGPLVQEHMIDVFGFSPHQIITHPGRWGSTSGTDIKKERENREIYHVHGFMPAKRHVDAQIENVYPDESATLILTEDSYHRQELEELYSWSSTVQAYYFNKYNCLFVGFSAEDYDFRRIIQRIGEIDKDTSRPRHYIIMAVDDLVWHTYQSVCQWALSNDQFDLKQVQQDTIILVRETMAYKEKYWDEFGITPLWTTLGDVPSLLSSLYP